jgi:hypothetical protein
VESRRELRYDPLANDRLPNSSAREACRVETPAPAHFSSCAPAVESGTPSFFEEDTKTTDPSSPKKREYTYNDKDEDSKHRDQ